MLLLRGPPKSTSKSYCKLLHGLLNTNVQNSKYYNDSASCLLCGTAPETLLHVFSSSHSEVTSFHQEQHENFWRQLRSLNTPQLIFQYLQREVPGGNIPVDSPPLSPSSLADGPMPHIPHTPGANLNCFP